MLDSSEVFLEDAHSLIKGIVVLLWVIDDFEKRFDDTWNLVELFLG